MLLSEGEMRAYTYTDKTLYGEKPRLYNELMFYDSEDVWNIQGRQFSYTLVLDGDTGVPPNTVHKLLAIAAALPESIIIQPAIDLEVHSDDTIFMHLEHLRQKLNEPITNALTSLLGQCGYFGKALLKNKPYIEKVIGTRDNIIERVPIDVLSHDTFEAAVLKPYYARGVYLKEAPSLNYITWDIREKRWNRGEIILSMYFWKTLVGVPMRYLQKLFQKEDFVRTELRTESQLSFVSSYLAHSALRQMFMKPLLLLCILLHWKATLYFSYLPIAIMMFIVIILPKLPITNRNNFHLVILESFSSIMQFTPEAIVGCVRIFRAYQANICKCCKWTPQRAVEEEFKKSNVMLSSIHHLWGYSVFSAALLVLITVFVYAEQFQDKKWNFLANEDLELLYFMLGTVFVLPIYTGLTSFRLDTVCSGSHSKKITH